jgi:hypothetical protein
MAKDVSYRSSCRSLKKRPTADELSMPLYTTVRLDREQA